MRTCVRIYGCTIRALNLLLEIVVVVVNVLIIVWTPYERG